MVVDWPHVPARDAGAQTGLQQPVGADLAILDEDAPIRAQ